METSALRTDPNVAFAVLMQHGDDIAGESAVRCDAGELSILKFAESSERADIERALPISQEGADKIAGEAIGLRVRFKAATGPVGEAMARADPNGFVGITVDRAY